MDKEKSFYVLSLAFISSIISYTWLTKNLQ